MYWLKHSLWCHKNSVCIDQIICNEAGSCQHIQDEKQVQKPSSMKRNQFLDLFKLVEMLKLTTWTAQANIVSQTAANGKC